MAAAGPLAVAACSDERRWLKRAAGRPAGGDADGQWAGSPAAAEARPACRAVSVAAAVAVWGRRGVSSSGAEPLAIPPSAAAPGWRAEGIGASAAGNSALSASAGPSAEIRIAGATAVLVADGAAGVAGAALLAPGVGSEQPVQPVQPVPCAKRARLVCPVKAGPPAFSWEPYVGHMATKVGRSGLWCLRCVGKPVGDYRVAARQVL